MARREKTQRLIDAIIAVIGQAKTPMTVRQVYYQLVSRQVVENSRGAYQAVSDALVHARREGVVPWSRIEDRIRRPRTVAMWDGLSDYATAIRNSYRRNIWLDQPRYLEVWLEKDALSGIFEAELETYGVTLNVGRGYDGWASIHLAACRFADKSESEILYFGDFDPSGEDMAESLRTRLSQCGAKPLITKVALTRDDIERYSLPPNQTKVSDSRRNAFVAKYGDVSVELDALPVPVLQEKIVDEITSRIDLAAIERTREIEAAESERLAEVIGLL